MTRSSLFRFAIGVMASLGLAAGVLVPQDPDSKKIAADRYEAALQVWTQFATKYGETTAECDTSALSISAVPMR